MNRESFSYVILKSCYNFLKFEVPGFLKDIGIGTNDKHKELYNLKNSFNGKCFLIGSGPSLLMDDLEKLAQNGITTFACNSLFKAYDYTSWRANIYCISDFGVFETVGKQILKHQDEHEYTFISQSIFDSAIQRFKNEEFNKVYPVEIITNSQYPKKRKFSDKVSRYVYPTGSVLYFMLQIAVYLGFKEIYLLGCDCNYSYTKMDNGKIEKTGDKDYFLPEYEDRKNHQPINQFDIVIPDYEAARKYAEKHDIKILNATRGGKLEVFERVDFDTLF